MGVLGLVLLFVLTAYGLQGMSTRLVGAMDAETAKSVSDVRSSLVQLIGGIGLLGGLVFTARTFLLTRAKQRTDRFAEAVATLGHDSRTVRCGGIHSIGLLVQEESRFWGPAEDVLCVFVKEQSEVGMPVTVDAQAALTVLGSRPNRQEVGGRALNLRGLTLDRADLSHLNFSRAVFSSSSLVGVNFTDTMLTSAQFEGADLRDAVFSGARANSANFRDTSLIGAEFLGARTHQADWTGSRAEGAKNLDK